MNNENQVEITIMGQNYYVVATSLEEEAYIKKTAKLVEEQVQNVLRHGEIPEVATLVYAAMNIADMYHKEQSNATNLIYQIGQTADQVTKLEKELAKLKSEKPKRETKAKPKAEVKPEKKMDKNDDLLATLVEEAEALGVAAKGLSKKEMEQRQKEKAMEAVISELEDLNQEAEFVLENQTKLPNC